MYDKARWQSKTAAERTALRDSREDSVDLLGVVVHVLSHESQGLGHRLVAGTGVPEDGLPRELTRKVGQE